jgi:hypothetical protein
MSSKYFPLKLQPTENQSLTCLEFRPTDHYAPYSLPNYNPPSSGYVQHNAYLPHQYAHPTSTEGAHSSDGARVVDQPKEPRCNDHGCNGRLFSTHSNLLRHQREKSGTASKSTCPRCGAVFTRKTAMNGHIAHDKCKRTTGSSHGVEK